MRRRLRLGLFVDSLEDDYQNAVLAGVNAAVQEHDVNLVCFAGGVLDSPERFGAQRNVIYELCSSDNVDALMIMSGALGNHVGAQELARFCERYRPLPMCSIALSLGGMSSVVVDNASGLRDAILHLLEAHAHRQIAFIRGPQANEEAERRYRVYAEVLAERGLKVDPELVVIGDFHQPSGAQAVDALWSKGALPRAIVAASDYMALGAMDALKARGLRVPEDVAVVGFDDVEEARYASPPLSTVRQPLAEQGRRAVELVLAAISGEERTEPTVLPTTLVVRGSCGCPTRPSSAPEHLERLLRAQAQRRLAVQRWARAVAGTGEALLTTFDMGSLAHVAQQQFPRAGIESCYVALNRGSETGERSRLILAWNRDGRPCEYEGRTFASKELVPGGVLDERRHTVVVEPLFFRDEQLGFAVFEMGAGEGFVYETLRDQISGALKGALLVRQVMADERERRRLLRYIVDITPDLYRAQPRDDLLHNVLGQLTALLAAAESVPAGASFGTLPPPPPETEGFLAMLDEDELSVHAATPRFTGETSVERLLSAPELEVLHDTLHTGRVRITSECAVLPLSFGELTLGVVYLERAPVSAGDVELLEIFSNQAAAAIRNAQLYEMAALDPLTGVHARRFFDQWLKREVKTAFRTGQPVSLLMIDMDGLKAINDQAGHLVGDQALATMGKVLRQATRDNDVVGRYGGDEFAVALPQTTSSGAEQVASRILELVERRSVALPGGGSVPIRCSIGASTLESHGLKTGELGRRVAASFFDGLSRRMLQHADEALYRAKHIGGSVLVTGEPTPWPLGARRANPDGAPS